MKTRKIIHCDMNNFYASVECMLNPSLREKAVAVAGSVERRHGIILAKNYKAKAFGVATGEAIWQAKQKCKDLIIVPPSFESYVKFSGYAREIYARYTDKIEPYGMDECWLDVTGSKQSGFEIADEIRKAIKFELGLTISAGVSFNKIFAKLGSDMKKPDAITCITEEGYREQVWSLAASEMLGVGRATAHSLQSIGIRTIGELAAAPLELLSTRFGINGLKLKEYANGRDGSPVNQENFEVPIKSIGHGITTIQDLEDNSEAWCVILELSQDIGSKLRENHKKATGVSITVRNNKLASKEWQCTLPIATQSATEVARAAFNLFIKSYEWKLPIRSLTVRAINLIDDTIPLQYDIFNDTIKTERREKLDITVENIRKRFGDNAIRNAVLCKDIKMPKQKDVEITMPTGMLQ